MSNKIYRLTQYEKYGQSFNSKGKNVYVLFGGKFKGKGFFATGDEDLQKAIENDKNFNKLFVLEAEEKVSPKAKEVAKTESSNEEETKAEETKEETADNELKVKNIQEANALAKKMFGKETPTFRLTEKVVEFFKQKGYTLSF